MIQPLKRHIVPASPGIRPGTDAVAPCNGYILTPSIHSFRHNEPSLYGPSVAIGADTPNSIVTFFAFIIHEIKPKLMMLSKSLFMDGKTLYRTFVLGIFALIIGTSGLQAQSDASFPDLFTKPTGDFLSPSEAERMVTQKIVQLKDLIVAMVPGTADYVNTDRAIYFYSFVQSETASGQEAPEAILTGLNYLADQNYVQSSNADIKALRDESIQLLRK